MVLPLCMVLAIVIDAWGSVEAWLEEDFLSWFDLASAEGETQVFRIISIEGDR